MVMTSPENARYAWSVDFSLGGLLRSSAPVVAAPGWPCSSPSVPS